MAEGFTNVPVVPPLPCLALLRERRPPPALPLHVFGPVWAARIEAAAAAKNAPADYVLVGLLAAASACIGNSRWASPWQGWQEPAFLWLVAVGNPSSGKSPGLGAVLSDVLPTLENMLAFDFPDKIRIWEGSRAEAQALRDDWDAKLRKAIQDEAPPPAMPPGAVIPPKPTRPRITTNDPTIEAVATLLANIPRGLLLHRDELAAFIHGFDRYNAGKGGSERASWLEAWNGVRKSIDRKHHPDPIVVPRFGVSIVGGLQPDRLKEITAGPDDGLAVRFLWSFPAARPFARPTMTHDPQPWCHSLARLLNLQMQKNEKGELQPLIMTFADPASAIVEKFAQRWAAEEAVHSGLILGTLGKARGQLVRLALVLELLKWAAEQPHDEAPDQISEECTVAAAELMERYFLPMAERAFGDGALTQNERNAATLLEYIIKTRVSSINERSIRETPGLRGLSTAEAVREAVAVLKRDDVLLGTPPDSKPGRPRSDHLVNPRLAEAYAALHVT